MVRALLDWRKTQTRRILKPQPYEYDGRWWILDRHSGDCYPDMWARGDVGCRPFIPGDRLWVRENIALPRNWVKYGPVYYSADKHFFMSQTFEVERLRPSIHMPHRDSRLTLIVTGVKVERLQVISEEDSIAEGCFVGKATGRIFESVASMRLGGNEWATACDWYADLWEAINGPKAWDANPWVIAVSFTAHRRNIDALKEEVRDGS